MIPSFAGNRSASYDTHVHSLFGLGETDFDQDGASVSLDDSPFILEGSAAAAHAEERGGRDDDWRLGVLSAHAPLPTWRAGHAVSKQTATAETRVLGGGAVGGENIAGIEHGAGMLADSGESTLDISTEIIKDIFEINQENAVTPKNAVSFPESLWRLKASDTTSQLLIDNATDFNNETGWYWESADISPLSVNGTISCMNMSLNDTDCAVAGDGPLVVTPENLSLCLLLLFFAVSTIFGNGLVIVAVARERYLHTVTNYFIMSLAVADCLVGALVMPFSALYDSFDYWPFGPDFCDVWRSFDVLASTASILNLCVISLDRYWAITDPFSYPSRMSSRRACMLIALVWVCSALISFPAIAWWRAVSDPHPPGACPFTEDLSYLVFSSTISFYGPLFVMVFTYFRIYRAATEQTRSLKLGQKLVSAMGDGEMELTLRIHRGGGGSSGGGGGGGTSSNGNGVHRAHYPAGKSCSYTQENGGLGDSHALGSPLDDGESCPLGSMHEGASPDSSTKVVARNLKNFSISRKLCKFAKEKKAAKTLGIVMGVFIVCWLPFFVTNLLSGLCGERCIREPALVDGVVTWLGWINSAMNPVIYACWAKDFRRAFTRILCSCCPRRCRKRYQTRWKGGIAQIIVTPVVSTLNTSFMKAGQRPYPPGPYSPVAPALATALVAATSPPSSSS
ncbi:LOW QUALITY PROTEIN: dopamine receptor 2-like [Penaeus monodon]|uniref:LOW QUALITY PROTEIN: dopamine receptor 2-like n=1 Tax=Penaeus monodon TaxID=6687 RepID=UPI0018A7AD41|nr:LOW QUALITY PROTEIN: dopamine receptor 2-like [Penaeus monodon]